MTDFEKCKVGDIIKSNTSGRIGKVQEKGLAWVLVEGYYILGTNVQLISAKESVTLDEAKKIMEDAGYTVTAPVVIPKFGDKYKTSSGDVIVVTRASKEDDVVAYIYEGDSAVRALSVSSFHTYHTPVLDN